MCESDNKTNTKGGNDRYPLLSVERCFFFSKEESCGVWCEFVLTNQTTKRRHSTAMVIIIRWWFEYKIKIKRRRLPALRECARDGEGTADVC